MKGPAIVIKFACKVMVFDSTIIDSIGKHRPIIPSSAIPNSFLEKDGNQSV